MLVHNQSLVHDRKQTGDHSVSHYLSHEEKDVVGVGGVDKLTSMETRVQEGSPICQ